MTETSFYEARLKRKTQLNKMSVVLIYSMVSMIEYVRFVGTDVSMGQTSVVLLHNCLYVMKAFKHLVCVKGRQLVVFPEGHSVLLP